MPSFLYKGVKVWLDGDMTLDWEWVNKAWIQLQGLKSDWNPHEIKFRQLSEHVMVRSYFGKDEIFIRARPGVEVWPEEQFEREVSYPLLYPAIDIYVEEPGGQIKRVGFVISNSPETLKPPFKFVEVIDPDQMAFLNKHGSGGESWFRIKGDSNTSITAKDILTLGHHEFEGDDIRWDLINPVWEGDWAPYPQGTVDADRIPRWVGDYEVYLHHSGPGDTSFWIGRRQAEHKGGWIYNSGIFLRDKVTNIWEKLLGCDLISSSYKTIGVPSTAGWFTGAAGTPFAQNISAIDMEYYAINSQNMGNYASYAVAKANESFMDVWRKCFPGCGIPCDQSVPHWGATGWWDELDHPFETTWPGWGWPWLKVERACATLEHYGHQNNAGHRVWSQNKESIYTTLGMRQPWAGAYMYQYTEWANIYEYKRDFIPAVPDQTPLWPDGDPVPEIDPNEAIPWPFCTTSLFVDCPCWWMKLIDPETGYDLIPGCFWQTPREMCRNLDGSLYEEGHYISQAVYSHDHLRVDDFEICLSTVIGAGMSHHSGVYRYYEYQNRAHFTWGVRYIPDNNNPDAIYFRYDYIRPGERYVDTWHSPQTFEKEVYYNGDGPYTQLFAQMPNLRHSDGRRLLIARTTRLVEITVTIVLEKEEDE